MTHDRATVIDALRDVYDPCCADRGVSIVDMGVVEDVRVAGSHGPPCRRLPDFGHPTTLWDIDPHPAADIP